jgi:RimJ/RimL family protein N-acetyltransferase
MGLKGKTIFLRLADISDATFIHSLRVDKKYNKYLSTVDDDISKQKEWLLTYKIRENLGIEYYYIIHRNSDSLPIGTVRIYDFIGDKDSFCWGSWILNENKPRYAALECALMIYEYAFYELGFKRCHMDIRKQNTKVIDFHKRFGVKIIGETEADYLGTYYREDFELVKKTFIEALDTNYSSH